MNYMYSFSDINTLYMIYARAIVKKKFKNRTGFLILEDAYIFGREISLKFKDSGKWTCLKNLQVMRGLFYVYGSCEFRTECKQIKIAWKMRKHWILVKKTNNNNTRPSSSCARCKGTWRKNCHHHFIGKRTSPVEIYYLLYLYQVTRGY